MWASAIPVGIATARSTTATMPNTVHRCPRHLRFPYIVRVLISLYTWYDTCTDGSNNWIGRHYVARSHKHAQVAHKPWPVVVPHATTVVKPVSYLDSYVNQTRILEPLHPRTSLARSRQHIRKDRSLDSEHRHLNNLPKCTT